MHPTKDLERNTGTQVDVEVIKRCSDDNDSKKARYVHCMTTHSSA